MGLERGPGQLFGANGQPLNCTIVEGAQWFIFKDQIKAAINAAIDAIEEWPYPDALPATGIFCRLDAIDKELEELKAYEEKCVKEARSSGVELFDGSDPPPYTRPPTTGWLEYP